MPPSYFRLCWKKSLGPFLLCAAVKVALRFQILIAFYLNLKSYLMNVPTAIGLAKQGQVEKQGTENFCSCHTVGGWLRNISVCILAPDLLLRYMSDYERGMNFRVGGSGVSYRVYSAN